MPVTFSANPVPLSTVSSQGLQGQAGAGSSGQHGSQSSPAGATDDGGGHLQCGGGPRTPTASRIGLPGTCPAAQASQGSTAHLLGAQDLLGNWGANRAPAPPRPLGAHNRTPASLSHCPPGAEQRPWSSSTPGPALSGYRPATWQTVQGDAHES